MISDVAHMTDCPAATEEAPICTCGALLRGAIACCERADWTPEQRPVFRDWNEDDEKFRRPWKQVANARGL